MIVIILEEGINVEALQTKYPIIDQEVYIEESRRYQRIIRVRGHTEEYQVFVDMLKGFDKDDLDKLWCLVKERFSLMDPTQDKEIELWVELKRLYEPESTDELWESQKHIHRSIFEWRLYDSCGVHHISTKNGIDIYMLVEKEYQLSKGVLMLMLVEKLIVGEDSEMARRLLQKIFIQAERPRQR